MIEYFKPSHDRAQSNESIDSLVSIADAGTTQNVYRANQHRLASETADSAHELYARCFLPQVQPLATSE